MPNPYFPPSPNISYNNYGLTKFKSDMVLTQEQLNTFFGFLLGEQQRTRTRLIGVGVVCGLEAQLSGNSIIIRRGCGVTSEGDLICFEKDETYTGFMPYDPPKKAPYTYDALFAGVTLRELVADSTTTTPLSTLTNLSDMVVMLYFENQLKSADTCTGVSCDEKGDRFSNRLRVLLVNKANAKTFIDNARRERTSVGAKLPILTMRRFVLNLNKVEYASSLALFKTVLNDIKTDIQKQFSRLESDFPTILRFSNPNWQTILDNKTATFLNDESCQYLYGWYKDIYDTYNEFREAAYHWFVEYLPDETAFSKHLLLGELNPVCQPEYRHYWLQSPAVATEPKAKEQAMWLFDRIGQLIEHFDIPTVSSATTVIRITPSFDRSEPLSNRAMPFYYAKEMQAFWNYNLNRYCRANLVPSYHFTPSVLFSYDIEKNNFYRIEGLLRQPLLTVWDILQSFRERYNLAFDIVALATDQTQLWDTVQSFGEMPLAEKVQFFGEVPLMEKRQLLGDVPLMEKTQLLGDVPLVEQVKLLKKTQLLGEVTLLEKTQLLEKSQLLTKVQSLEKAQLLKKAQLLDKALLLDKVQLLDEAKLLDEAQLLEKAPLLEEVKSLEKAQAVEKTQLLAKVQLLDDAQLLTKTQSLQSKPYIEDLALQFDDILDQIHCAEKEEFGGNLTLSLNIRLSDNNFDAIWRNYIKQNGLGEPNQSCIPSKFELLRELNAVYKTRRTDEGVLANFFSKHKGMEHGAGVPRGGTFVLVYKNNPVNGKNAESIVVADYYLPYMCCGNGAGTTIVLPQIPPIIGLPKFLFCQGDEPVPITLTPPQIGTLGIVPISGTTMATAGNTLIKQEGDAYFLNPSQGGRYALTYTTGGGVARYEINILGTPTVTVTVANLIEIGTTSFIGKSTFSVHIANATELTIDYGDGKSETYPLTLSAAVRIELFSHDYPLGNTDKQSFNAIFSARNGSCDVIVHPEIVNFTLPVSIQAIPNKVCRGTPISLIVSPPGGQITEGATVISGTSYTPSVVGTHTLTYTLGSTAVPTTVEVLDVPVAEFHSELIGTVVHFFNDSANMDTVTWDFGDNTPKQTIKITPALNGDIPHPYAVVDPSKGATFKVVFTVNNGACSASTSQEVVITGNLSVRLIVQPVICFNMDTVIPVNFTPTTFDPNGGTFSSLTLDVDKQKGSFTPNLSGTHTISYQKGTQAAVTVKTFITPSDFTIDNARSDKANNKSIVEVVLPTPPSTLRYIWLFNDTAITAVTTKREKLNTRYALDLPFGIDGGTLTLFFGLNGTRFCNAKGLSHDFVIQ